MTGVRTPEEGLLAAIVASDEAAERIPDSAAAIELDLHRGAALQLQVLQRHIAAGDGLAGWKVGMTSGDSRDAMGAGVRPFGFVRRSRLLHSEDSVSLARIPGPGIEIELGARIGTAVGGPDVSRAEIVEAIDVWAPCFELIQGRLPDAAAGVRLAADLSQWGVVVGDGAALPVTPSELVATLERDGAIVASAGPDYAIDDPIESLRALCAGLDRFGLGLLPGQHVITGAFAKERVTGPGRWVGSIAGLGRVELTVTA